MENQPSSDHPTTEQRLDEVTILHINVQKIIHDNRSQAYRALQDQVERPFFTALMSMSQGNKTQAARIAGLDTGTLNRYLARHDIIIAKSIKIGGKL
jgi:DNA-binding protein Fis